MIHDPGEGSEFVSKDYKKLGKELGKTIGILSGIAAFQALIIALTAGGGTIWTGIRSGIASVKKILLDGVSKAIKAIGKVLSKIKKLLGTIKNSIKGLFKGIGKGTKKIFKGMKGKLDDILESITKLIDDILKKIGLKAGKKAKWFSKDPLVGDIANKIDNLYPGKVKNVNVPMYDNAGKLVTDADIVLDNAILQIKSGGGKGATTQYFNTKKITNLKVILYGPDLKGSIIKGIRSEGGIVVTDINELIKLIK